MTNPMPIFVWNDGGSQFNEDLMFNSSKGTELYGETAGTSNTPSIRLCGNHVLVDVSGPVAVIIRDMILEVGDCLDDRFTPVLKTSTPIDHNLAIVRVQVDSDYDVDLVNDTTGLHTSLIDVTFDGSNVVDFTDFNLNGGYPNENSTVIKISSAGEVHVDGMILSESFGPVMSLMDIESFSMSDSAFARCATGPLVFDNFCIFVSIPDDGLIEMSGNVINRIGASFYGRFDGNYFSALWIEFTSPFVVNSSSILGTLDGVIGWSIFNLVPVGIRINGVSFTPDFLALPQATQTQFPCSILVNNPSIVSSFFHDVVINDMDDQIIANASTNQRLYCSHAVSRQFVLDTEVVWYIILFIALSVCVIVCFVCFDGKPFVMATDNPRFGLGKDLIPQRRKRWLAWMYLKKKKK
jgi:hypothetical protein